MIIKNSKIVKLLYSFIFSFSIYIITILFFLYYAFLGINEINQKQKNIIDIKLVEEKSINGNDDIQKLDLLEKIIDKTSFLNNAEVLTAKRVLLETKLYMTNDKKRVEDIQNQLKIIDENLKKFNKKFEKQISKEEKEKIKKRYVIAIINIYNKENKKEIVKKLKSLSYEEIIQIGFFDDNDELVIIKESLLKDFLD